MLSQGEEKKTVLTSTVLWWDSTVFVVHCPNWTSLSQEDKSKVQAARGKSPKKNDGKSKTRRRELHKLRCVINKSKRQIALLQKQVGTGQETEDRNDAKKEGDAGEQFCGKRLKRMKD